MSNYRVLLLVDRFEERLYGRFIFPDQYHVCSADSLGLLFQETPGFLWCINAYRVPRTVRPGNEAATLKQCSILSHAPLRL